MLLGCRSEAYSLSLNTEEDAHCDLIIWKIQVCSNDIAAPNMWQHGTKTHYAILFPEIVNNCIIQPHGKAIRESIKVYIILSLEI